MLTRTLIHKMNSYDIAILVVYCLGSLPLAAHIYYRWLASKGINFLLVYSAVMCFTIAWGFMIFEVFQIFGYSPSDWIISLPIGFTIGIIAGWSDRIIVQYLSRRLLLDKVSFKNTRSNIRLNYRGSYTVRKLKHLPIAGRLAKRRTMGLPNIQLAMLELTEDHRFAFLYLVLVAVLEELIYRGFLVKACFLLPTNFLIVGALTASVALFALSHVRFGWSHVLAKLPLSILAMISVLCLRTVVPAIVAHVVFNMRIWRDRRNQSLRV
jgi:hypothetical protein